VTCPQAIQVIATSKLMQASVAQNKQIRKELEVQILHCNIMSATTESGVSFS
jgi:hypothetical protein